MRTLVLRAALLTAACALGTAPGVLFAQESSPEPSAPPATLEQILGSAPEDLASFMFATDSTVHDVLTRGVDISAARMREYIDGLPENAGDAQSGYLRQLRGKFVAARLGREFSFEFNNDVEFAFRPDATSAREFSVKLGRALRGEILAFAGGPEQNSYAVRIDEGSLRMKVGAVVRIFCFFAGKHIPKFNEGSYILLLGGRYYQLFSADDEGRLKDAGPVVSWEDAGEVKPEDLAGDDKQVYDIFRSRIATDALTRAQIPVPGTLTPESAQTAR